MKLLEMVLGANDGQNVKRMAESLGIGDREARSGIESLLPALARGLKSETASPEGLQGLLGALKTGNHQRYVDDPKSMARVDTVTDGNGILGHIFGSKDVSRQVAARASERSGVDTGILKKMLPLVATMVMGSMSKQTGRAGLDASASPGAGSPGGLGILGNLLDADDDGSIADDLLGLAKKFF
jgi:hypothetical protein